MNEIQKERFRKHINFIRGVPEHGLKMWDFYTPLREDLDDGVPKKQTADCGYAACVAGWLVVSEPELWKSEDRDNEGWGLRPFLKENSSDESIKDFADFFGIGESDAAHICLPSAYSGWPHFEVALSKEDVLGHMEYVAKEYGAIEPVTA